MAYTLQLSEDGETRFAAAVDNDPDVIAAIAETFDEPIWVMKAATAIARVATCQVQIKWGATTLAWITPYTMTFLASPAIGDVSALRALQKAQPSCPPC